MAYIDGFIVPVPEKNLADYKRLAKLASKVWMEHGALEYYECVGDDLVIPPPFIGFPKLTRLKKNETVIFAWIVYKSKAHRDRVNAKVMKDPRMQEPPKNMPFDHTRMSMGGFKVIVKA